MSVPRVFVLALSLALAVPAAGAAAGVRVVSRDEPLVDARGLAGGGRVLPARAAPFRFNLVGLHWRGSGEVAFRTASPGGSWSPWKQARPEAEDGPDRGTSEAARRRGWKIGNPYWTGSARRIQYRVVGAVSALRAHFLWSPPRPLRRLAVAGAPRIISRAGWGANETIVRDRPSYARRLAFAVVHHTAGRSAATPEQSAAVVRAIQAYHVRSNAWDDIGYNFLVDRFGQIFEGRRGGVARNVIGAHAKGFNTGSVGVAAIGAYGSTPISAKANRALVSLLAWRLDVAHVDPLAPVSWVSAGSPRFPPGTRVSLRAVSGHRDTGLTSCPGNLLYRTLPDVAAAAAAHGLPKLYDPRASGVLGGPIRFTARLSSALDWTVTVTDGSGARVAGGRGSGTVVDWTWDSSAAAPGRYAYAIEAGPDVRPAKRSLGALVPFDLTNVTALPRVVTPNGDGVGERTRVRFSLTAPASIRAWVEDADGTDVTTVASRRAYGRGTAAVSWAGTRADGRPVPDGRYALVVEATAGAERVTRYTTVVVDRTLGVFAVRPHAFSPNGDGRLDTAELAFDLARRARVVVRIFAGSTRVVTIFSGTLAGAGRRSLSWNGRARGETVSDGRYRATVAATTVLGQRRLAQSVTVDTARPRVSRASAVRGRRRTLVRFTLSEPGSAVIWLDGKASRVFRDAGATAVWRRGQGRRVRIVAWDAAGNRSRAVSTRVRA